MEGMSVKELRAILDQRGVSYSDCVEKADLVRRVEETKDIPARPPSAVVPVWVKDETIADLRCQVAGNTDSPKLVIIIAHGYGANNEDFVEFGRQLLKGLSADNIQAQFIFPNGFLQLPGGGISQRAWWPIDFQALFGEVLNGRLHIHVPPGLDEARRRMTALIEALKTNYSLKSKHVVIGGFSQGAMLTTDVALHMSEPPAALLVLSGTFVAESVWKPLVANRKGLRVLQQHGTSDQILPYRNAEQLRDFLKGGGLEVDFLSFGGGHGLGPSTLSKALTLLKQIAKEL